MTTTASPPRELVAWIRSTLDEVKPGQFLLIEYLTESGLPVEPYAQAALDPGGWYCEVVSTHYLPSERWPLDELALTRDRWHSPDPDKDNWWQRDVGDADVASRLIGGLWNGRSCRDAYRYAVSVGTFPSGPGGGEEQPADHALSLAA